MGAELNPRLIDFLHRLEREYHPTTVILHGSYARGDTHELSDIDLIIVGDFPGGLLHRMGVVKDIYTDIMGPGVPHLEAFVYTDDEFAQMQAEERPFIMHALEEGQELL